MVQLFQLRIHVILNIIPILIDQEPLLEFRLNCLLTRINFVPCHFIIESIFLNIAFIPPLDEFPRNGNLKRIGLMHIRIKEDGGLLIPITSNSYLNEQMHHIIVFSLSNFR